MDAQPHGVTRLPGEIDRIIWLFRGIVKRFLVLKLSALTEEEQRDICFFAHEVRPHLYPSEAFHGFFPHETRSLFDSLQAVKLISIVSNPFEDVANHRGAFRDVIARLDPEQLPKGICGDVIRLKPLGQRYGAYSDDHIREFIEYHDANPLDPRDDPTRQFLERAVQKRISGEG